MKTFALLMTFLTFGISGYAQTTEFLLDFGPNDVTNGNITTNPDANGSYWNNITDGTVSGTQISLFSKTNQSSSAYVEVTQGFLTNGILNGGLLAPSVALLGEFAIATATQDYFFTTGTSSLKFGGLVPGDKYVFSFFGTRQTTAARTTEFELTGATTYTGLQATSGTAIGDGGYNGNNDQILVSDTLEASAGGIITLDVSVSAGGFAYLGLMKMTSISTAVDTSSRSFWVDMGPDDGTNGNATANPDANGTYWNNLTNPFASGSPITLVTGDNSGTNASIKVSTSLSSNGILNGGLLSPVPGLLGGFAVGSVTEDYFFTDSAGSVTMTGLNPYKKYWFRLFGSRNTTALRRTRYTLSGSQVLKDSLQTSGTDLGGTGYHGNNSTVLLMGPVQPNELGQITLTIAVSTGGFAYLNALQVEEVDVNPQYLVDFGPNDLTNGNKTLGLTGQNHTWNNAFEPATTADTVFLATKSGDSLSAYLTITQDFLTAGILNGGLVAPQESLLDEFAVATATQDYFFTTGGAGLEIGGLDPAKGYVFSLFGTRAIPADRISQYDLSGQNTYTGTLQTSGAALGNGGYDGNNDSILVTDMITPDANGKITLDLSVASGGFAYLGAMKIEEVTPPSPVCSSQDPLAITIMGSSVAEGFGAPSYQGYAFQWEQLLDARETAGIGPAWTMGNVSIGGNNTIDVLNRWDTDLLPECGSYVVYGLSLGNEGIMSQGQAAFDQFEENMLVLIDQAKARGITPILVNCYANNNYDATDYAFTKQMNLLIHGWDVPSINALGALDNGAGQWPVGYSADAAHPNAAGHAEIFYSIPPSLLDALQAGKVAPVKAAGTFLQLDPVQKFYYLSFIPEGTLHPFSMVFDVKTTGTGEIASFSNSANSQHSLSIDPATGVLDYQSPVSAGITGAAQINDGAWHQIALSYNYAMGEMTMYVDGVLAGTSAESMVADSFFISSATAPQADYRDWYVYRSAINSDEANALYTGSLLQSSLELYAPLDGQGVVGPDSLVNLAQSLNEIVQIPTINIFPVEWLDFNVTVEENQANLEWLVAPIGDFIGFDVQMRAPNESGFTTIGAVPAQSYTESVQEYDFLSPVLNPGEYQFRLLQYDLDGSVSTSEIRSARIGSWISGARFSPNPVSESGTIQFDRIPETSVRITIMDATGKRVSHITVNESHTSTLEIDCSSLPSGMYFLRISDAFTSQTIRFIKE